jgi:signal transduction histidine kinase/CheY-like chemotaxis protein/HPt (histidine-containing phosphotransfer) domain-containing protein
MMAPGFHPLVPGKRSALRYKKETKCKSIMKLKYKFLIISIMLSIIPLGLAGIISIKTISTELRSTANDHLVTTVQQIVKKMEGYIECVSTPVLLIRKSIEHENLGPDEIMSLLKAAIYNVSSIIAMRISVEGIDSPLFAIREDVSSKLKQMNIDPFSKLHQYEKIAKISNLSQLDLWIMPLTFNLEINNVNRRAYLTAIIDMNDLYQLILKTYQSRSFKISILNSKGCKLFDKSMPDMTSYEIVNNAVSLLSSKNSNIGVAPAVRSDGEKMLLAYGIPQNIQAIVFLEQKEADAYMIVQRMKTNFLMWMLIVFIVTVVASIIVSSSLSKPIITLFNHVNFITKEHRFDQHISIKSNDEIGHLANAFNSMNDSLFNYYQKQKQAEYSLRVANETLEKKVVDRTKKLKVVNEDLQKEIIIRKEAEVKANAASHAKSTFLANMSHEIRTPMNGILGMINIVLDSDIDADNRECLETANQSAESLLTIINDILDFSKIEAGKVELESIAFDFRKTINNISEMFIFNAKKKELDLLCQVHENVPNFLKSDPGRLRQILTNITGNAIKFTNHGYISITVTLIEENETHASLNFSIIDTGIGISKENQNKLFKSFSQTDSSITRKYGGTGLGLVISRQLIEMMDGNINVKSEKGKGTEFCFSLVFEKCNDTEIASLAAISDDKSVVSDINVLKNINILLVDDVVANQKVAMRYLSKYGCHTHIASNGIEALEMLETGGYDIVLMDVQMPEMDGIEATKIIRASNNTKIQHDIPVIAMTAHAMKGDKERFIEIGMNDYVSKPFQEAELVSALQRNIQAGEKTIVPTEASNIIKKTDTGNQQKIIDFEKIVESFDNDKTFIENLLSDILKDSKARINHILTAVKEDNYQDILLHAHSVKSMAGSVFAHKLSHAAYNVEATIKKEMTDNIDSMVSELTAQFHTLIEYIDTHYSDTYSIDIDRRSSDQKIFTPHTSS